MHFKVWEVTRGVRGTIALLCPQYSSAYPVVSAGSFGSFGSFSVCGDTRYSVDSMYV